MNEDGANKWPDQEAVTMSGGEPRMLAFDIADPAYMLDQGAIVGHAAVSEPRADNEIGQRYCSMWSVWSQVAARRARGTRKPRLQY